MRIRLLRVQIGQDNYSQITSRDNFGLTADGIVPASTNGKILTVFLASQFASEDVENLEATINGSLALIANVFDKKWYIERNSDVSQQGLDPLIHYVMYGEAEYRSPHPLFDPHYYQSQTADKIERPLTHFMLANGRSGLDPHPLFSTEKFIAVFREELHQSNPLTFFLENMHHLKIDRFQIFDKEWYLQQNPDVANAEIDAFLHYVKYGEVEYRSPHPLFDPHYYQSQTADKIERPLTHFMLANGRSGLDPHALFPVQKFLDRFDSKTEMAENPLLSFINNEKYEVLVDPQFNGRHFANELDECYEWPKHSLTQYLKRAYTEVVSAHAGPFPIHGEENDSFAAEIYQVDTAAPIDGLGAYPEPVAYKPQKNNLNNISERYVETKKIINSKLKLGNSSAPKEARGDAIISLIMPVYKPPLVYLDRAIRSVISQNCPNWQLCVVDDCSNDRELTELLTDYESADPRIKIGRANANGGISKASNAALALATGDFVSFIDNDDMLTHDAIKILAEKIRGDDEIDFIYTDECVIDENDLVIKLFSKPDWSPTFLLSCMYTGHLTAYRRSLVAKLGGFRSQFDFSQDYDLALRAAELSRKIIHIPAYLYGWRAIPGSAAAGGKPTARLTNVAALQSASDRRNYNASALGLPATNTIRRIIEDVGPRVSIIIPSDDLSRIKEAAKSIKDNTAYQNVEIIVVTKQSIIEKITNDNLFKYLKYVPYDEKFNFSDKCNRGATRATGDFLLFFNDDVRIISQDWIQRLLDYATLDYVGAVAPKLLYENKDIQHAGMVTGVRRLVGTAFHAYPSKTSAHFGTAQFVRDVSLLCGACLMVKTAIFRQVGGFDAKNVPINHSDVDLCFKIRASNYKCVYVATTVLLHIGHMSIGEIESKSPPSPITRDKADIFLLKRWAKEVAYDPYFPPAMRDIIYKDSQQYFQVYPSQGVSDTRRSTKADILIVSHDLSGSGAPKIVFDLAKIVKDDGCYICVISPEDGPLRSSLNEAGIDVIIDKLLLTRDSNVFDFAKNFDLVIANTIVAWPFVTQTGDAVPLIWYIHESAIIDQYIKYDGFSDAFKRASEVWVGSEKSGNYLTRNGIEGCILMPYGADHPDAAAYGGVGEKILDRESEFTVTILGSFEKRKGQDIAVKAMNLLSQECLTHPIKLRMFGRIIDELFFHEIKELSHGNGSIFIEDELSYDDYLRELRDSHVILVPSRDDTLPLISIDALAYCKPLVISNDAGTCAWLINGKSALILEENTPLNIARALQKLAQDPQTRESLAIGARQCFDQNFSWNGFKKRVLDNIHRLLL